MQSRWWLGMFAVALVATLVTGCNFPRDPMGTLGQVRGEEMRVGVALNEPWTQMDGEPSGVEVELLKDFARELKAKPVFVRGTVPDMLTAAREGEIDVVIGGFTESSPVMKEQKEVGLTIPYLKTRLLVGVPSGQRPFGDLSGHEVAVESMDETAAYLKQEGAVPVLVQDLSSADKPIAAYEWQLEEWGYEPTGIKLPKEKHVMAVPLGENGWLVRLERFLNAHRDEAEELLRKETAK
jgi:polar amino acid transport system substrate-binding protein